MEGAGGSPSLNAAPAILAQLQLNDANTRMLRAEEESNPGLKLAARKSEDLVDSKCVGQPFKFSGKTGQDFSEWSHKFKTFVKAKYGEEIDKVLSWAVRQKKVIVKDNSPFSDRQVAWNTKFGDAWMSRSTMWM